ncbi:JmjC domain-containing protein [Brevundimonas sp. AAP58]|uniref:JmjC domain-containing protein n=1 Tax=Brevundimonas sp. AAP58 TaxID=1523422 RepID=UPI0006B9FE18|nr:cupin domain-containing protein [Brevundimonas sp. AAP58]
MRTFEDILAPIGIDRFRSEHLGTEPLHVPAPDGSTKRELLTWAAFNGLLAQTNVWDSDRLQMMHREVDVPPDQYCRSRPSTHGPVWRPDPEMVRLMLGAGASILANDMLTLHAPITEAGVALGEAMGAKVGASVFCSFKENRVLGTHYDVHDVFAVQTEGEKIWNFYEGRVSDPLDYPPNLTHADIEKSRGRLVKTVTMRPGDVLYVPRGVYHDAIAVDAPSLHVSFTVMPLTGRALLVLLDMMARDHPAFRKWLPSAASEPEAFARAVADLGPVLAEIVSSPSFRQEAARQQRRASPKLARFDLPERLALTLYQVTGRAFPAGEDPARQIHDWMMGQRRFALEHLKVQFDGDPEPRIDAIVKAAEQAGAIARM